MYNYEIESVDHDWTHYSEELKSTFDITQFIKIWDTIRWHLNKRDVFSENREIIKITCKG